MERNEDEACGGCEVAGGTSTNRMRSASPASGAPVKLIRNVAERSHSHRTECHGILVGMVMPTTTRRGWGGHKREMEPVIGACCRVRAVSAMDVPLCRDVGA